MMVLVMMVLAVKTDYECGDGVVFMVMMMMLL